MKNLFEQSRSHWVRYDRYELKTDADGKRYITPGKNAKPDIYAQRFSLQTPAAE